MIHSTHKGILKLNFIPDGARTAHIFLGLKLGTLISLDNIYDDGFNMTINIRHLRIYKIGQHLMT